MEASLTDLVAEEFCHSFAVGAWKVQHHACCRFVAEPVQQKIVSQRSLLGGNARAYGWQVDVFLNLLRRKVPQSIDLFSLKYPGRKVTAYRSVCESGQNTQVRDEIVMTCSFHI